jgi:Secretion system C-terminal sorting domain
MSFLILGHQNIKNPFAMKHLITSFSFLFMCAQLMAQSFGADNVVVTRVKESGSSTFSGSIVLIDEYKGYQANQIAPVRSITMPNVQTTNGKYLTINLNLYNEGKIMRSLDGKFLTLGGFNYPVFPLNNTQLYSSSAAAINRSVAVINNMGSVDLSTTLTDAYDVTGISAVASTNGIEMWSVGAKDIFNDASLGVRFFTKGATTSTAIANNQRGFQNIFLSNNDIYVSNIVGGLFTREPQFAKIAGQPTSGTNACVNFSYPTENYNTHNQFVLFDLSSTEPGYDVLYVAVDATGIIPRNGINKYSKVNGAWQLNEILGGISQGNFDSYLGLCGFANAGELGNEVVLYATRKFTNSYGASELVKVVDVSGYNGIPQPSTVNFTVLATASPNEAFRGVALAPLPVITLPIRLNYFDGQIINQHVQLKWSAGFEQSLVKYEIEKSDDGIHFQKIGEQLTQKNYSLNIYKFDEPKATNAPHYYRLKMIDLDGTLSYSKAVLLGSKSTETNFSIFPNPSTTFFTLQHDQAIKNSFVQIFTTDGKLVAYKLLEQNAVQTTLNIEHLRQGNYTLLFQNGGIKKSLTFIKQ